MTSTQTGMLTSFYEMISKIFIKRLKVYLNNKRCRNINPSTATIFLATSHIHLRSHDIMILVSGDLIDL